MTETAATDELRRALASEEGGRRWVRRGIALAAVATAIGGGLVYRVSHRPPPPAKYVSAVVATGDVVEKVLATGTVQPVSQVNIGAQVSGRVARVLVDFNTVVHQGDALAEIDPTVYGSQVSQQEASLAAQRASVESARAVATAAQVNFDRIARLSEQGLASKAEFDTARGQLSVEQARVNAAQAQVGTVQAQLQQSQTNVRWTKILSPVDGVVVTRSIDPGATVVASFQTPTLFVIAQDLRKMRVLADVDEADVGKLKEGMDAEAVVDAFPGEIFKGRVQQIRYSPNNVSGVVTYSAVVEVDNPDDKLRPGMTSTVTIKTRESRGVARIPNSALRYKPSPPKDKDGKLLPQAEVTKEPPPAKGKGRLYVLVNDKAGEEKTEVRTVDVGVTDGVFTELATAALPLGAKVVTDETDDEDKKKKAP